MKTKRLTVPEIAALLFTVLLCAFLFLCSRFDKAKVWTDVRPDYEDGKTSFSLEQGDGYGIKSSGPYYDLPVGTYRIKWQITGDGDNILHLTCSNDARITPDSIPVSGGSWEGEAAFEVLDPVHNLSIGAEFASGTRMTVHNIRLYSPGYKDNAFFFLFIAAAFWSLYFMNRAGKLTPERRRAALMITAAAIFSCVPFLSENVIFGYDVGFHSARIMNLADEIASLQIPGRVGGFSYNGWGGATSVFYPDLFLYPFALMILCGSSVTFVLNSMIFGISLLTGCCMYAAARRFLRDDRAGLCAAILYTLSVYRIYSTYIGPRIGETLAMAFLPLFFWGLYCVFRGDASRWPVLLFAAVSIFNSHLLSTLVCACAAAVYLLFSLPALREKERRHALISVLLWTVLLCIHRLVPLAQLYLSGITSQPMQFGFANGAISVNQLFFSKENIGIALWIGVLAVFPALEQEQDSAMRRRIMLFLCAGFIGILLASNLFPWRYILVITTLPTLIQFPTRFLLYTAIFFALAGGFGLARKLKENAVLLTLTIAVGFSVPYINEISETSKTGIAFGEGANPYQVTPEYQITGTDVNDTRSRTPLLSDGVTLTAYEKKGTAVDASLSAQRDGTIALPMFGFDGYEAKLDGVRTDWTLSGNNRLTVSVSAGEHTLTVRYAGKTLWRVLDLVSFASLILLLAGLFRKRRNPHG